MLTPSVVFFVASFFSWRERVLWLVGGMFRPMIEPVHVLAEVIGFMIAPFHEMASVIGFVIALIDGMAWVLRPMVTVARPTISARS